MGAQEIQALPRAPYSTRVESAHNKDLPSSQWNEAVCWLLDWQQLIQNRDFDAASHLFQPDAVGFGTVTARADELTQLIQDQWLNVWPYTSEFRFQLDSLTVWNCGMDNLLIAVQWISTGIDAKSQQHFDRHGRASIGLQRQERDWKAIHTHFSLNPQPERFLPSH